MFWPRFSLPSCLSAFLISISPLFAQLIPSPPIPGTPTLPAGHVSMPQTLTGHVPKEIQTAPLLGDLPLDQKLYLGIGLPYRDQKAVDEETASLYDPKSPNYKMFLSGKEIGERFGPSREDYQKVVDFFKSHGFEIVEVFDTRIFINIKGTVADIQDVFHIHLHNYKRPDGTIFHAPDTEPFINLDIPLSHISGLDTHFKNRPRHNNYLNRSQNEALPDITPGTTPTVSHYIVQ